MVIWSQRGWVNERFVHPCNNGSRQTQKKQVGSTRQLSMSAKCRGNLPLIGQESSEFPIGKVHKIHKSAGYLSAIGENLGPT